MEGELVKDAAPLRRIAFLGGYLPRLCGIATFTHDLCEAVAAEAPESLCFTGAVNDQLEAYDYPERVRFELDEKDLDSYRRAADFLNFNNADVLCVQHEFGIYGGPAGSHLLALLKEVRMPVVTTLHTVLREPNPAQQKVMEELVRRSDRLVVMAHKGAEILRETYGVPDAKVDLIPHGIPDIPFIDSSFYKAQLGVEGRMVLLTFGLLGPGKGIEHAIEALPEIVRRHPNVVYLVLGATHPHLVAREGESYRLGLERLAEACGVKEHVIFYNRFVSLDDLKEFIGATDIYLTPYLNEAQITSGTLAYVFGAGKAVVSTPYWHAQELLADGRGILVPFRNPQAIAEGVCTFLDDPARLQRTREEAYLVGREMIWPAVAQRYLESFRRARADRKAAPVLDTIYSEAVAALSPDGKWLAFQSDQSGRNEVYVEPFEGATAGTKRRWLVSSGGGGMPRWRGDGSEMFYMTSGGRMMAVSVHPAGGDFQSDTAHILFQTRPIPGSWNLYDVSSDGQRFLLNLPLEWSSAAPITVVTNWTEKLKD